MRQLLERMQRVHAPPFHTLSASEARAAYARGAEVLDLPRAPLPRVQDLTIPSDDGAALPARLYAAGSEPRAVLLYLHGGGFTIGSIDTHDSLCRQLALQSGVAVVSLGYRLAPEHRFPTAADDAWAALQWLARAGHTLGLDPSRLAIGGDSAGATLSAVSAIRARDAGLPLALQLLITPGTAATTDSPSHLAFAQGYVLDAPTIQWFYGQYIDRTARHDWRFAPLEADDLEGVAPACVLLAECDPLADEGLAYADRLRAAGVPVSLEIFRGVTHDFIKMGRAIPEAVQAQHAAVAALVQALT